MAIRFIVDGNISGWARSGLVVLGITLTYCGLVFRSLPKAIAVALIILGSQFLLLEVTRLMQKRWVLGHSTTAIRKLATATK